MTKYFNCAISGIVFWFYQYLLSGCAKSKSMENSLHCVVYGHGFTCTPIEYITPKPNLINPLSKVGVPFGQDVQRTLGDITGICKRQTTTQTHPVY